MSMQVSDVETMAVRSAFMRLITSRPEPDDLAHALVRGPFLLYGAFATTIYAPTLDDEALQLVGQWGFGKALVPYSTVPLTVDFALVRAYLTGQVLVKRASTEFSQDLSAIAIEAVLSEQGRDVDGTTVIAMPLQYGGVSIGASVTFCAHEGPMSWNDYAYVDGTAALIAMWLQLRTLESTVAATTPRRGRTTQMLTDRQRAVLSMIRDGKSNAAIAASLGYSISTVKNDVQALFTVLGATRRRELVRKAVDAGLLTGVSDAAR